MSSACLDMKGCTSHLQVTYIHVQQALEAAKKGGGSKCETLPFSAYTTIDYQSVKVTHKKSYKNDLYPCKTGVGGSGKRRWIEV